jgi:signal transduction histidine kinase
MTSPESVERATEADGDQSFSDATISTRRVLALGLPSAAFIALSVAAQTYLSMLDHGHAFWRMLLWQLSSWVLWALLASTVLRAGGSLSAVQPRRFGRALTVVALGILLIAAHLAIIAQLAVWVQPFTPVVAYGFPRAFIAQFGTQFATDILVYTVLLLIGHTIAVSDGARRLALRKSRLEAELVRANLEALRLEIQPHFLFNTLNAIAALIRLKSNDKALDMLLGLSAMMRATIDRPVHHLTPLSAELDFVKQYVDLQTARFGDRLQVSYAVDGDCLDVPVPTFLLQPLVENALRHAVAGKPGPSHVEIGATFGPLNRQTPGFGAPKHSRTQHPSTTHPGTTHPSTKNPSTLEVWVSDDGVGLPPGFNLDRHQGTGLKNIRVRLQQLYGPAARLEVTPRTVGGTLVFITLPSAPLENLALASA